MFDKYKIEIKWAFIFIGVFLLWMLFERLVGVHDQYIDKHPIVTMFFMLPVIALYALAIRDKKNNFYNGEMNFKQGFMAGFVIAVILTIFSPLTQWIISNVITPHYFDNVIAYSVDNGHSTLEEAQAYFNYKSYAIQSTVSALLTGTIVSAIIALVIRTKAQS